MSETILELDDERDWCLWSLTDQVIDGKVDTTTNNYLIEQVNESHTEDTSEGHVVSCKIGGCVAQCVVVDNDGILRLVATSNNGLCDYDS